jgi:hypothetical protein
MENDNSQNPSHPAVLGIKLYVYLTNDRRNRIKLYVYLTNNRSNIVFSDSFTKFYYLETVNFTRTQFIHSIGDFRGKNGTQQFSVSFANPKLNFTQSASEKYVRPSDLPI